MHLKRNLRLVIACLCLWCKVLVAQGDPYPSAANAWPAWKHVLEGKRVGLVIHRSSTIGKDLMPEVLLASGVDVRVIFVPEHGLRLDHEAGASVGDHTDVITGLPVISLYGKRKAPQPSHTDSLDILVFDLQDVGVRFYTYLSTLHYVMEACARDSLPLLVLDRPNVNDYTTDGPVLDTMYKSFVGIHPIPVMHGMTIGELARMIKGERWVEGADGLDLQIWPMVGYRHGLRIQPPCPPSPNLRDSLALAWYPTLCFFEGCPVSVGRGTSSPFTMIGSPWLSRKDTCFVPISIPGRAANPIFRDQICCGLLMRDFVGSQGVSKFRKEKLWTKLDINAGLKIELLLWAHQDFVRSQKGYPRTLWGRSLKNNWKGMGKMQPSKDLHGKFFNSFFDLLAGGPGLRLAIIHGKSVAQIRASWQPALHHFRRIRSPYLMYP
jgi:uncharacterized protein YbbC (DUF1343 family)